MRDNGLRWDNAIITYIVYINRKIKDRDTEKIF
jgi:hypothetical protein